MKLKTKNILIKIGVIAGAILIFLLIFDYILMPIYVSSRDRIIPNVVGKNKDEAIKILNDAGLNPIIQTSRFDQKYQKDQVLFQKPAPNTTVKTNRRIYLTVSGGEATVKMPSLISKTIRDAKINLERIGLVLGKIDSVESEFPVNLIVEQQYFDNKELTKGTTVSVKVSIGPKIGMIRVPNLLGKSLSDAEILIKGDALKIGSKTFIYSSNLLPNTVVDQQPSENTLLKIGDTVNVVLTQGKIGK
jgi:serine/threonine-protein kinase